MEEKNMSEVAVYLKQVEAFERITPMKADELLEEKAGHIVFIGRETYGFCRKFVRTLSDVAKAKSLSIRYVHAQDSDYTQEIQAFRNKYDIPTVPGFLFSNENGIKVKCDSSMSAEQILSFVNA